MTARQSRLQSGQFSLIALPCCALGMSWMPCTDGFMQERMGLTVVTSPCATMCSIACSMLLQLNSWRILCKFLFDIYIVPETVYFCFFFYHYVITLLYVNQVYKLLTSFEDFPRSLSKAVFRAAQSP